MEISPLRTDDRLQAAELVAEAFPHPNGWPTIELALEEVDESLAHRACLAARDGDQLLGWVAATGLYRGRVWELHPLVVRDRARGGGIGSALVDALARDVAARGGLTLWVGTDDDRGETNLAHVELYPAPLDHVRRIEAPASHPLGFYVRAGFALSGIIPDANGSGLPAILLARRLARQ
ncbi:MAG TPA: GNAT family N-acetyltransferase [Kofleriaceae bacterium]|jgi:aminoglycoside 6'-N-acetyltransferase I